MNRLENGLKVYPYPQNVAVVEDVDSSIKGELKRMGLQHIPINNTKNPDQLAEVLRGAKADILIVRTSSDVKGPVLTDTGLSLVHAACKGPHVDLKMAQNSGIEVLKVDTNREEVWAWVRSALCSAASGMSFSGNLARGNTWAKNESGKVIFPLEEATLGVLGFGDVGQRVAMGAKALGMKVMVHNHEHEVTRPYDSELRGLAKGAGLTFVDSESALYERSDIITVHIDKTDALGNTNQGHVTVEKLAAMKAHARHGIFINGARGDVAPTMEELNRMLHAGSLLGAFVDAHPSKMEAKGEFKMPENLHPGLVATHHIAGSGKHITRQTAVDVGNSLEHWLARGDMWGTSRVYPHADLSAAGILTPGTILARVNRGTSSRAGAKVLDAVAQAGLEQVGERALSDYIPGTRKPWDVVPHLLAVNGITDLAEDINRLAYELDKINKEKPGTIVSVQFFPTDDTQKETYRSMRS